MPVNTPASWSAHALEYVARDVVSTSSLARVNTIKCFTHVGHGVGEPTVLGSGPRRWHGVTLKACKEYVKPFQKQDFSLSDVAGFNFVDT
jgi:hypothetical protein